MTTAQVRRYRKRPVVVEAVRYGHPVNAAQQQTVKQFCPSAYVQYPDMVIPTLEGDMVVTPGDYVVKGVHGEFYPCKPDIFAATYEPVEEQR